MKKQVNNKFYYAFFLAFCISVLSSCHDEEGIGISTAPFLKIAEKSVNFEEQGGAYELCVLSNSEYVFRLSEGLSKWCTVTKNEEGYLALFVQENTEKNVRRGEIYVTVETKTDTVSIAQLGWGKAILLSRQVVTIEEIGGNFDLAVTTNVDYEIGLAEYEWIKEVTVKTRAHEVKTNQHQFVVEANDGNMRNAKIEIKDSDPNSALEPAILIVLQNKIGNYVPEDADVVEKDILVKATSVTGDGGCLSDHPYEGLIDGTQELFWHTVWAPSTTFPQYIEFTFEEKVDLDYFIYYRGRNGNECFKDIVVEVFTDDGMDAGQSGTYKEVYRGIIPNEKYSRINFDESQNGVSKVKITMNSSWGKTLACREVEFYKRNPSNFDYTTLFADLACTQLKSGITEQEILSCPHSFYRKIAWYIYKEKYPQEFRIADYKAYPYPYKQALENKTSTYSLLDNPTGISVETGENLIVMADLKGRPTATIRVQNLDKPGNDGFGGEEYIVQEGINIIPIKEKGLIYVMYHQDDYETLPAITLHFASGNVNGYYDSQNPAHEGRWEELINNAVDKYFDVLGKYAHLTFPTLRFRNNTKDGKALIDWYDQLVYREAEFLGLMKYDRMFKNRAYFHVIYTSYMYAAGYRTAYHDNTLDNLTNETILNANCWGPAHELGHVNQIRPGLKWLGLAEVTNNISSLYIQTSICNETSRLEKQGNYTSALNNFMVTSSAHGDETDPFRKLPPFWQLELYYGKCLGRTPMQQEDHGGFYPEVCEWIRTHKDLSTSGAQQLEFVYICCEVAKANLLDFFEKWGFLTPIDKEFESYGRMTITEKDIDALKARVNALGYPEPDVALEYITDRTVKYYQNPASVIVGTASIAKQENILTLSGWQNVVAIEMKDAAGKLVYVNCGEKAEGSAIQISLPVELQDGYTIYAVAVDGTRTKVNVK